MLLSKIEEAEIYSGSDQIGKGFAIYSQEYYYTTMDNSKASIRAECDDYLTCSENLTIEANKRTLAFMYLIRKKIDEKER